MSREQSHKCETDRMERRPTKPPLRMSPFGMWIERGGKIFFYLEGVTRAEHDQLEIVLLALNELDLSGPKARRAIMAVVRTWPGWMAGRSSEQVEVMSR